MGERMGTAKHANKRLYEELSIVDAHHPLLLREAIRPVLQAHDVHRAHRLTFVEVLGRPLGCVPVQIYPSAQPASRREGTTRRRQNDP